MRFKKPPLVEAWIAFNFDSSPTKRSWDPELVKAFFDKNVEAFPFIEIVQEHRLQVQHIGPGSLPRVVSQEVALDSVRARNSNSTRWLQLADDKMIYNLVRSEEVYPGFARLRDEAMAKFTEYVGHFRPSSVRRADLHYVDAFEIPVPSTGIVMLEDYFNLRAELPPAPFDKVFYFSLQMLLRTPDEHDTLEVVFKSELPSEDKKFFRLRMDWNMSCKEVNTLDAAAIINRLDRAHGHLGECFLASITDRTKALLEPFNKD